MFVQKGISGPGTFHWQGKNSIELPIFNEFEINLTKIQSTPIVGKPYEYLFYIDFEWNNEIEKNQSLKDINPYIIDLTCIIH